MALVIFATLVGALLLGMQRINFGSLMSYSTGLLAYAMILTVTFMASRPRIIERYFGLPKMYEVHAMMAVVSMIMILIHIPLQWNGWKQAFDFANQSITSTTGFIAVYSLIVVMFTGIFSLSGVFVNHSPNLRAFKNKINREVSLWLHRLAILVVILIYIHVIVLRFNIYFKILLTIYTVAILGYYFLWKLKVQTSPDYQIKVIEKVRHDVWRIVFEPVNQNKKIDYKPGDYFFIRLKNNQITGEPHPFSTTSSSHYDVIEFMIKEEGDWTGSLQYAKIGDIAKLEGPYGNYYPDEVEKSVESRPFVMLSGGIGITPNLSVVRYEFRKQSNRPLHFVWGLAVEKDLFLLDELEKLKKEHPNFSYHIIFSNEEVEGFDKGFIDAEYLTSIGAGHFETGEFFVCGPPPMLSAVGKMLAEQNVPKQQIHIDEFGF